MYNFHWQGITSFGDGCGKRGKYGIYTRTAGYVMWMRDVMNNKYFDWNHKRFDTPFIFRRDLGGVGVVVRPTCNMR